MNNTSGVKSFFEYLPSCIKFHKLKNEGLAKTIFLIVLLCQLIANYFQYKILNSIPSNDIENLLSMLSTVPSETEIATPSADTIYLLLILLGLALLVKLVSNLLYSVYMYSYLSELKGKDSGFVTSFKGTFKHMGRLVFYNIIFGIMFSIGLMFFIIPGIIVYAIFVFGFCYILDLKLTVADAMTACSEITKGKKTQIISVFIGFVLLFELPMFLLFSGGSLGTVFMASFFGTITSLILQRLITKVYLDLEYKKENAIKK